VRRDSIAADALAAVAYVAKYDDAFRCCAALPSRFTRSV
jgi:hypothetical protein